MSEFERVSEQRTSPSAEEPLDIDLTEPGEESLVTPEQIRSGGVEQNKEEKIMLENRRQLELKEMGVLCLQIEGLMENVSVSKQELLPKNVRDWLKENVPVVAGHLFYSEMSNATPTEQRIAVVRAEWENMAYNHSFDNILKLIRSRMEHSQKVLDELDPIGAKDRSEIQALLRGNILNPKPVQGEVGPKEVAIDVTSGPAKSPLRRLRDFMGI